VQRKGGSANATYPQLVQGETTTGADLLVVLDGGAANHGAQRVQGARVNLLGLWD